MTVYKHSVRVLLFLFFQLRYKILRNDLILPSPSTTTYNQIIVADEIHSSMDTSSTIAITFWPRATLKGPTRSFVIVIVIVIVFVVVLLLLLDVETCVNKTKWIWIYDREKRPCAYKTKSICYHKTIHGRKSICLCHHYVNRGVFQPCCHLVVWVPIVRISSSLSHVVFKIFKDSLCNFRGRSRQLISLQALSVTTGKLFK